MACCALISNNPSFTGSGTGSGPSGAVLAYSGQAAFAQGKRAVLLLPVQGTAFDVLVAARDRIHQGWKLLNHPLYGNFQPHQQPFRSLLVQEPEADSPSPRLPDPLSLELIEAALDVYQRRTAARALSGATVASGVFGLAVPLGLAADAARIDVELLRATLDSACPC